MNQYHCETCEHLHVTDKGMPPDCEKTNHWLTESDRKLMKEVGCASHSEFRSEKEKVLDKLISMIQHEQPSPEPYDDWNDGVLYGCEIAINVIDEMKEGE